MYWLHHVGKTYWTPAKFRSECKKHGVSRRIAVRALSNMEFGDKVLLAMWDGKKSVIFGQFTVDTVYFQKPETRELVDNSTEIAINHRLVNRGCGSYMIVGETVVQAPLHAITQAAEQTEDQLMVGGKWEDVPKVILKKVPHRLGFRGFDWGLAETEFELKRNAKGEPVLYGQYYVNEDRARAMDILLGGLETKMVRIAQYRRKGEGTPVSE